MTKTLGSLMSSSNFLRIKVSPSGASHLGFPIYALGGFKLRIRDNNYELNPEKSKALSYTGDTGKIMKKENDILMMKNFVNDLGYSSIREKPSKRKTIFTKRLPKLVEEIQNKKF